jgi:hypothetical protein
MRYELSDREWATIRPMLPNKARGHAAGRRSACLEWHLLGAAVRRAVARSTDRLRSLHYVLQPLCALAANASSATSPHRPGGLSQATMEFARSVMIAGGDYHMVRSR